MKNKNSSTRIIIHTHDHAKHGAPLSKRYILFKSQSHKAREERERRPKR